LTTTNTIPYPSQDLQQNILITNGTPPQACLADFGLSTFIPGAQGEMTTVTAGGTPVFMAPELLCPSKFNKPSSRPAQPADIYALGLVIYEVLTGSQPFHEQGWWEHETVYHVITGLRPKKPANAEQIGFGDGTWELVEECWIEESTKRPTIDRVLTHLARVAASSKIVGPTPDEGGGSAAEFVLSDDSGKLSMSLSPATLTSIHKIKYNCSSLHRVPPIVLP